MRAQKGAAGLVWAVERVDRLVDWRPVGLKKAAARGRSALALPRTPPRGLCIARGACSGASRIGQVRRPATPGEHVRPTLAAEGVPNASRTRRWPAAWTPRNGGLTADDVVASHSAVDGAGPPIEAARTCAGGISRGAAVRNAGKRTHFGPFWECLAH